MAYVVKAPFFLMALLKSGSANRRGYISGFLLRVSSIGFTSLSTFSTPKADLLATTMIEAIKGELPAGHRVFPLLERPGLPQPLAEGERVLFSPRSPEEGSDVELSCGVSVAELANLTLVECCRHLERGFDPVLTTSIVVRLYVRSPSGSPGIRLADF